MSRRDGMHVESLAVGRSSPVVFFPVPRGEATLLVSLLDGFDGRCSLRGATRHEEQDEKNADDRV